MKVAVNSIDIAEDTWTFRIAVNGAQRDYVYAPISEGTARGLMSFEPDPYEEIWGNSEAVWALSQFVKNIRAGKATPLPHVVFDDS